MKRHMIQMNRLLQLMRDNAQPGERKPLNVVRNEAAGEATLYLYDVIDPWWGLSAEEMAKTINGLQDVQTLHLRINSPGGDVFEGRSMRTALAEFKGTTIAHVDGLCASAATTVADGCSQIVMVPGSFWMIHNGWTLGWGNKHDLGKTVGLLEKVDAAIAADYVRRTGADLAQVVQWMDDETWFEAAEAVEQGFATSVADDTAVPDDGQASNWVLNAYSKVPKALVQAPAQRKPVNTPEPDWAAQRASNERRLQLFSFT